MLKTVNNQMIVDVPILEIYLPFEYQDKGLYFMKGELIEFFAVCNMKAFKSESELEHRAEVKTIPVGIPMMITSNPSDLEVGEVRFTPNAPFRKCIILRYYKGDQLMTNTSCISASDNVSNLMNMLENGKLDFIPVKYVRQIIDDAERLNGVNLRMSSEAKDAMVIECYRDPSNIKRPLRFAKNKDDPRITSVTAREESILASTYQAFSFEDINSSLIAAVNRSKEGVKEVPTVMEQIVRGGTIKPSAEQG